MADPSLAQPTGPNGFSKLAKARGTSAASIPSMQGACVMIDGKQHKYFTVDARAVLALGRESIKDHTTAVLELVKNSYDAGATVVDIAIVGTPKSAKERYIRIADNGHGMTETDVDSKWLRIGFSAKSLSENLRGS